jgi:putative ABC transport system ATP-binding protein
MRAALRTRLEQEKLSELVVPFEPGAYNKSDDRPGPCSSVLPPAELADKALAANPYFSFGAEAGLDRTFYKWAWNR